MATGTVASRATGFVRTVAIAYAIGDRALANAYNVANVLPNIVYELLLGGVLTSVVVPLLVAAAQRDQAAGGVDRPGEAYAQQLLTLVTIVLGATSLVAVLIAPQLMALYGHAGDDRGRELAVTFARFFLPQILFYGVGAMVAAILNTRSRFAAPMWAPVLNNLVVIVTVLLFLLQNPPTGPDALLLTTGQLLTLAIGTTTGIVVQTVALLPSLRASGFRLRPRFDLRLADLLHAGRLAGWVFAYVAANQAGLIVVINLAQAASRAPGQQAGAGYSPYVYAFALFSLPHAIVGVSIITALLPRMSRAAVGGHLDRLRADLSAGMRLAGVLIVPAAVGLLTLGPFIGILVFDHGNVTTGDAQLIGFVLAGFALGLVPFSAFQLQLRAFYALGDTRTPALVNVAVNAVNVAVDLALYTALPPRLRVVGLAVGYSASYAAGLPLASRLLARRLPAGRAQHVVRCYVRLSLAAALGAVLALPLALLLAALVGPGAFGAGVALAGALTVGGIGYLIAGRRLRVAELASLASLLPGRVARRLASG